MATCLSTFVAARQLAPEPSASSPSASSSSSSLCSRPLVTTLWGAAFAFFSLMADTWPASKAKTSLSSQRYSLTGRLVIFVTMAPLPQAFVLSLILEQMFVTWRFRRILRSSTNPELIPDTMSMSNKLRRVIDDILILFGINHPRVFKKSTRIVANAHIVLGIRPSTTLPSTHIDTTIGPVNEDNMADALTLGHKTAENSCLMVLNRAGKLALLETTSILPNYQQLRFLDGRSGIATFIMGVQAGGYAISTAYRATHNLPVSPIEAIGFPFSILVIVHSLVHSLGVICPHPLVIYLHPTQEQEMLDKCESTRWSNRDDNICANWASMGVFIVWFVAMGAFTAPVFGFRKSSFDAIGPILFMLSYIPQLSLFIYVDRNPIPSTRGVLSLFASLIISLGGIVVSIVATIVNWQTNKFDSRTPSAIHSLPFLG